MDILKLITKLHASKPKLLINYFQLFSCKWQKRRTRFIPLLGSPSCLFKKIHLLVMLFEIWWFCFYNLFVAIVSLVWVLNRVIWSREDTQLQWLASWGWNSIYALTMFLKKQNWMQMKPLTYPWLLRLGDVLHN